VKATVKVTAGKACRMPWWPHSQLTAVEAEVKMIASLPFRGAVNIAAGKECRVPRQRRSLLPAVKATVKMIAGPLVQAEVRVHALDRRAWLRRALGALLHRLLSLGCLSWRWLSVRG
jgi:hypothetical protein